MGRRGERRVERRARDATRAGFKFARIATRGAQLSFLAPVPIGTWHPAGGRGEGGRARTCAPASVSAMGEFTSDSATRARRGDRRRGCGTRRPRTRRGTARLDPATVPVRSESRREGARGATPLSSATVASGSRGFVAASGASDAGSGAAGGGSTVAKSSLPLGLTDTLASSETFFAASAGRPRRRRRRTWGGKKLAMFAAFTGVGFLADIEVRGRSGTLLGSCAVVPHARVNAPEACGKAVDISNPSRERLNSRFRLSDWTPYGVTYLGGPTRGEIEPRRARGAPRLSTTPSFADSPSHSTMDGGNASSSSPSASRRAERRERRERERRRKGAEQSDQAFGGDDVAVRLPRADDARSEGPRVSRRPTFRRDLADPPSPHPPLAGRRGVRRRATG